MAPILLIAFLFLTLGSPSSRKVFIFRHCVRSTSRKIHAAREGFDKLSDYTDLEELPDWGTPEKWCTRGGFEISEGTGRDLRERFIGGGEKVEIVADTSLGRSPHHILYDSSLFDSLDPEEGQPSCRSRGFFNISDEIDIIKKRLASIPMPMDYEEAKVLMQSIIGYGKAGPLTDMKDIYVTERGKLGGAISVIKVFGQMLFYSFASGTPWVPNIPIEDLYKVISWQHFYRAITEFGPKKATANALLLRRILWSLSSPKASHTSIFVGHDGNLNGITSLLNLTQWNIPPYLSGSILPTPPNTGFLIERFLGSEGSEDLMDSEEALGSEESMDSEEPLGSEESVDSEEPKGSEESVDSEEPKGSEESVDPEEPLGSEWSMGSEDSECSVGSGDIVEISYVYPVFWGEGGVRKGGYN
ncbi:hypothetical protein AAMO2058_000318700 [Amorphochlora amoebiformis]